MICRPRRSELVLVFMKATDACILVGKVEFILAHSQRIFCKSNVFDNFAQVTLAPQRVRMHCTRVLLACDMLAIQAQSQKKISSSFFLCCILAHSEYGTHVGLLSLWQLAISLAPWAPCCHYPIRTRPLLRFPQAPLIQLTMMN